MLQVVNKEKCDMRTAAMQSKIVLQLNMGVIEPTGAIIQTCMIEVLAGAPKRSTVSIAS